MIAHLSPLLIFGELEPNPYHLQRLAAMGCSVTSISGSAEPTHIRTALETSRFVLFNNVDINPYLESFQGVELGVLAATGYDFIDVERARFFNLRLAHLPAYSTPAVVEYLVWAIISTHRPLHLAAQRCREGDWRKTGLLGGEIDGLTAGIVGYGEIGSRLAPRLAALGMEVQISSRTVRKGIAYPQLSLEELLATSDAVFICCSSNATSQRMIDARRLSLCRDNAVLISVAPNGVLELDALAAALQARPQFRAVLDLDPIEAQHPLLSCKNAMITPHVAFLTEKTLLRRLDGCINTVESFLAGEPVHYITAPAMQRRTGKVTVLAVADPLLAGRDEILETASSFYYAQSLYALVKLGIADLLKIGPQTSSALATELGVDPENLELLLRTNASKGFVVQEPGGNFRLSNRFSSLLDSHAETSVGAIVISAVEGSYKAWGDLVEFLRTGRPKTTLQSLREGSSDWATLLTLGSDRMSNSIVTFLAEHMPFLSDGRILDVGAGAATITRFLLKRHCQTTAVLMDRALVLDVCARCFLEPEGLLDRCTLLDVDFRSAEHFPGSNELIVLSNVVHLLAPDDVQSFFDRCRAALKAGGSLLLVSFLLDDDFEASCFATHFSLSCRLLSGSARGYSIGEVTRYLQGSGLTIEKVIKLGSLTRAVLARRAEEGD